MTVNTEFHDWQELPDLSKTTCSPALVSLGAFLIERWGGQDLGCYGQRSIIGGTSMSSHASGAAIDWRYQEPGPGRDRMLNEVIPFLVDNSAELGVQAIHDYVGSRIWRSYRSGDANDGWLGQEPDTQMGQSWALWLHLEVTTTAWDDGRPIAEKLTTPLSSGAPPVADEPPDGERRAAPAATMVAVDVNMPVVRRGDQGAAVMKVQRAHNMVTGDNIPVDGDFGPVTGDAVRRVQAWFRSTSRPDTIVDETGAEIVGAQTWSIYLGEPWNADSGG